MGLISVAAVWLRSNPELHNHTAILISKEPYLPWGGGYLDDSHRRHMRVLTRDFLQVTPIQMQVAVVVRT